MARVAPNDWRGGMTQNRSGRGGSSPRGRGFALAGGLVQPQIRKASVSRGFTVSRLVTHWAEVVGEDVARLCRPVKVAYGRTGMGATLTLLARGAAGPMLQAQLPAIRDRVNACYGYTAISQIRLTQTSATGFAEGAAAYGAAAPLAVTASAPSEDAERAARAVTEGVTDPDLRAALAGLGARILTRPKLQGD